jgi:phosphatidylinositol phospholipase C beta
LRPAGEKLKKVLIKLQLAQVKTLQARFEVQSKEMKMRQAKLSVDTAKEVYGDKTLRNKAERERRLREKNCNNTKKFIEERRAAAMRQSKEMEKLRKMHEKQLQELDKHNRNALDAYSSAESEYRLSAKAQCCV